jgi:hypothetical protein
MVTTAGPGTTDQTADPAPTTPGLPQVGGVAFKFSVALAAVSGTAGAFTFFADGVLTGAAVTMGSARGTALVVLVVAVPLLALSIVGVGRGSPVALLGLLGADAYLLYNAFLFLFATPFNQLFLLYVVMFSLALWAGVAVLYEVDVDRFARRCATLPVRAVAVYVWVIVAVNALVWLRAIVPAVLSDDPAALLAGSGLTTNPVYIEDLAVWLPLMAVAADWLWRRRPWGYLVTGAVLTMWVVEGVGVATDQWFGHAADPTSALASTAMVPAFAVMAAIGAVPVAAFVRALRRH